MRRLGFRQRVALAAAGAVAIALVAAAGAAYVTVERNLRSDLDAELVRWTQDKAVENPDAKTLRLVPAPRGRTTPAPAPAAPPTSQERSGSEAPAAQGGGRRDQARTPRDARADGVIDPRDPRNDGIPGSRPQRAPADVPEGRSDGRVGAGGAEGSDMRPPDRPAATDPPPRPPDQESPGGAPPGGSPPGGGPPGGAPPGGSPPVGVPRTGSVAPLAHVAPVGAQVLPAQEERTIRPTFGGPTTYWQLVDRRGAAGRPTDQEALPVTARDRAVATGTSGPYFWDRQVRGVALRGYTTRIAPGVALQVARPVAETEGTLSDLARVLVIVTLVGILLGAILAWMVSRRALRPVAELTRQTEDVAATGDLSRRVDEVGDDEIGRLAHTFNDTLAQLEQSSQAQQRLVADASHELRTPLASLRANVEVLRKYADMDPAEREELIDDVVVQAEELTTLISDIVHAGDRIGGDDTAREVRLDDVVRDALARAERLAPGTRFDAHLEPVTVQGLPERLERLVGNLLDNAVKYGGGGCVQVTVQGHVLQVRDFGPGFAPEDLPHVFERFWRADTSRALPGSGLGLAIVQGVATMHGAQVRAANAPGGGALITVTFPQ